MVGTAEHYRTELEKPEVTPDVGLLKIERWAVRGRKVSGWEGGSAGLKIVGHENLGFIAKIGEQAAWRWGGKEEDRVALEEYLP